MLVSVVIPSYNHSKYVLQTIRSVLAQEWKPLELIVIDDGSSDGSANLVRDFHKDNPVFTYVSRENRGLIHTLNEGLSLAKGNLFCEIASDDCFPLGSIAKRAEFLQAHPECVAVFADGQLMRDEKLTGEKVLDEKRRLLLSAADPIPAMLNGTLPVFSTGMYRREILQTLGGFDATIFRYYEDLELPLRLALAGRLGYLDDSVIIRRDHETNVSKTTHHIRAEKILCYEKLLRDSDFAPYHAQLRQRLTREYLALCRCLKKRGEATEREISLLKRAWRYVVREPRLLWYLSTLRFSG